MAGSPSRSEGGIDSFQIPPVAVAGVTVAVVVQPPEYLCHPRPTDAKVSGYIGPVLRDSGIDQTLVKSGECLGITVNTLEFRRSRRERLRAVPGVEFDDMLSS